MPQFKTTINKATSIRKKIITRLSSSAASSKNHHRHYHQEREEEDDDDYSVTEEEISSNDSTTTTRSTTTTTKILFAVMALLVILIFLINTASSSTSFSGTPNSVVSKKLKKRSLAEEHASILTMKIDGTNGNSKLKSIDETYNQIDEDLVIPSIHISNTLSQEQKLKTLPSTGSKKKKKNNNDDDGIVVKNKKNNFFDFHSIPPHKYNFGNVAGLKRLLVKDDGEAVCKFLLSGYFDDDQLYQQEEERFNMKTFLNAIATTSKQKTPTTTNTNEQKSEGEGEESILEMWTKSLHPRCSNSKWWKREVLKLEDDDELTSSKSDQKRKKKKKKSENGIKSDDGFDGDVDQQQHGTASIDNHSSSNAPNVNNYNNNNNNNDTTASLQDNLQGGPSNSNNNNKLYHGKKNNKKKHKKSTLSDYMMIAFPNNNNDNSTTSIFLSENDPSSSSPNKYYPQNQIQRSQTPSPSQQQQQFRQRSIRNQEEEQRPSPAYHYPLANIPTDMYHTVSLPTSNNNSTTSLSFRIYGISYGISKSLVRSSIDSQKLFSLNPLLPSYCCWGRGLQTDYRESSVTPLKDAAYATVHEEYLSQTVLRHALFSFTNRRGNFDCQRHTEILSQGIIPFFPDLILRKDCWRNKFCLPALPKKLLLQPLLFPEKYGLDEWFEEVGNFVTTTTTTAAPPPAPSSSRNQQKSKQPPQNFYQRPKSSSSGKFPSTSSSTSYGGRSQQQQKQQQQRNTNKRVRKEKLLMRPLNPDYFYAHPKFYTNVMAFPPHPLLPPSLKNSSTPTTSSSSNNNNSTTMAPSSSTPFTTRQQQQFTNDNNGEIITKNTSSPSDLQTELNTTTTTTVSPNHNNSIVKKSSKRKQYNYSLRQIERNYYNLAKKLLNFTQNHLTCGAMVNYVLKTMGFDISKEDEEEAEAQETTSSNNDNSKSNNNNDPPRLLPRPKRILLVGPQFSDYLSLTIECGLAELGLNYSTNSYSFPDPSQWHPTWEIQPPQPPRTRRMRNSSSSSDSFFSSYPQKYFTNKDWENFENKHNKGDMYGKGFAWGLRIPSPPNPRLSFQQMDEMFASNDTKPDVVLVSNEFLFQKKRWKSHLFNQAPFLWNTARNKLPASRFAFFDTEDYPQKDFRKYDQRLIYMLVSGSFFFARELHEFGSLIDEELASAILKN